MKNIKTIYLGCENNGEIASLDNHIIRFCHGTIYAHPTIMSRLGSAMWEQQYLAEYTSLNMPMKYCVLLPRICANYPIKPENSFTGMDTITWFIENLHPPRGGAIFTFYYYEEQGTEFVAPWSTQVIWPLNKEYQWVGDGDYITLHDIEPSIMNRKKGKHHLNHKTYEVIKDIDNICPYDVKRINYAMGEDEIFKILKHSRLHVSYHGGTVFSAGMINIPTICFGWRGYDTKGHWNNNGEVKEITIQQTSWNSGTTNPPTQIHQYDWKKEKVMQGPQNYLINVDNINILKGYIMGMMELKWINRTYIL